jgi:hypothetical protein
MDAVPGALVFWARDRAGGDDERLDRLLLVSGADTTELLAGRSSYRSTANYPACRMAFTVGVPLAPGIYWAQSGSRLAVAAWDEDRIDIFDGPRLTRSIRLAPRGPEIGEDEAVRLVEAAGRRGPCNSTARELVRTHGYHRHLQRVRGVALAPDGSVWVARVNDQRVTRVTVWDRHGAALGMLPDQFPWPLNFLPDGRPVVALRDSLDLERLAILQIRQ